MAKRIFSSLNSPYYVFAPPYRENSGGVRAMHYLCHALNLMGEEAYVLTDNVAPGLRTPKLTNPVASAHASQGRPPIVVYPEVVPDNPMQATNVVRFLLNTPGLLTGHPTNWQDSDLIYSMGSAIIPPGMKAELLAIPAMDYNVYNSRGTENQQRHGKLLFINRYLGRGGKLDPFVADATEISFRVGERTPRELADLYRSAELLYTYEHSTACLEAMLCGCPVVYLPNDVLLHQPYEGYFGRAGWAWGNDPALIEEAKRTVRLVAQAYEASEATFWQQLDAFVNTTQAKAAQSAGRNGANISAEPLGIAQDSVPPSDTALPDSVGNAPVFALNRRTKRIRVGIISADKEDLACFNIRVHDPLSRLGNYIDFVRITRTQTQRTYSLRDDLLESCDVFLVQRLFPSQDTASILDKVFACDKPVLYETDDLLDQTPPDNPMYDMIRPRIPFIRDTMRKATAIMVSTPSIREHYSPLNIDISVFPNYLSEERWLNVEKPAPQSDVITIGFAGTNTHLNDIRLIENAIFKVARYFGDKVRFVFWGCITDSLRTLPNATWINTGVSYLQYPKRLASLNFDIGLVPLGDTLFNRGKSHIKWMEYSALGIPAICSDVVAHALIKEKGLGQVIPNEENAWFDAIVHLIEHPEERAALGKAAQTYVRKHLMLTPNLGKYADWISRFVPLGQQLPAADQLQFLPLPPQWEDDMHIPPDEYELWRERHQLQEVDAEILAERMMRWPKRPLVTVLMTVAKATLPLLAQTVDALQKQLYPHWKLIILSDLPAPDPVFHETDVLGWLQIDDLDNPELLSLAVNQVLTVAPTDLFCLMPVGTEFEPHAFVTVADYFQRHPEWSALYTDHDHLDHYGVRRCPAFKPDFNLDLLRSKDYLDQAIFLNTQAVQTLGGLQPYPQAELYDLVLRLCDHFGEKSIGHIAEPLLSLPLRPQETSLHEASLRVAVESHLSRRGIAGTVKPGLLPGTQQIIYDHGDQAPLISIIIPNRDKTEVLTPCLSSLVDKTDYRNFEVIIVDNQSEDPDVFALYDTMRQRLPGRFSVVSYDAPFNFAAQVNLGARHAQGSVLVLLNNDCEIIRGDWLNRLLNHGLRPEVGAVGALLIAPETGEVQHGGVLLGPPGGLLSIADHAFAGHAIHDGGYLSRLQVDQNYSAVTAACMMIRKDVYESVQGFDADNLAVLMNDVDFCLRLGEAGYKIVWTPYARLVHHEGRSLKGVTSEPERILRSMLSRWLPLLAADPAGNRHLSLKDGHMRLETRVPLGWNPDMHDRNRVLGFPLVGGSGEYRVSMPLRGLAQAGLMHTEIVQPFESRFPEISVIELARQAPDSLLLHSSLTSMIQDALPVWREHLPKLHTVFGIDDRIDAIPEKSSVYLGQKRHFSDIRFRLRKFLKHCDTAVASTEPLAVMLKGMIDDIRVIPNTLERHVWEPLRPLRQQGRRPRVGWVGAQQHRGDLELIYEVVKATAREIEWVFMGMWLPEFAEFVKERKNFVSFKQYPEAVANLNLDLAIAPLEINEFNEAKSNLRLLEYGILGYPVICTDIFPYQTGDAPVTRLPNDAKRWIEAIHDKVGNLDALAREGDQLRQWVLENYMLDQHIHAWYEALTPHA